MSDSNRGEHTKARLIWAAVAATIFVLISSAIGGSVQLGYEQQATDKAAQYERWIQDEIRSSCAVLAPQPKLECARQAQHSAYENERQEYDLYAQRTSALWAGIMAIAALVGIGLSGVGIYLVWTTFAETRQANVIAEENLRAIIKLQDVAAAAWVTAGVTNSAKDDSAELIQINFGISGIGKGKVIPREVHWGVFDTSDFPSQFPNISSERQFELPSKEVGGRYISGYFVFASALRDNRKAYFCHRTSEPFWRERDYRFGMHGWQLSSESLDRVGWPDNT